MSESSVHSKVIEPFEAASISMTLAPIPASAVTTLPPITAAASTPAPVSTPITVVTSTSRNSSGMKLSRGRKVHSKDEQVIGQPLRSRNRNLQANQDRSENKFVRGISLLKKKPVFLKILLYPHKSGFQKCHPSFFHILSRLKSIF